MKKIQKSGITIVTLVITVIILVILTGAVMLTMVGDNGIFRETQTTIDKYNKQAMLEQIQLKIQYKRLAKVNEGQYSLKLEEDILPILETFGTYNESEMKLTTTEKNIDIYLYEIVNIPINEIANVTYTNQELTISEKVSLPNGYTFEYTKDNGITWSEYTSTTTIAEENGILIRLKNEEGKIVSSEYKVTSGVIEEIDSTKPIISIDTNGATTGKTIKVTIIVTDEKGLDRNNTYEYCISNSSNDTTNVTWIPYTNGISFTVGEGLTGGYYIHVKGVTDTAGNESGNKVSEMLTFDNTVPVSFNANISNVTATSITVQGNTSDNNGQAITYYYSADNGATWLPRNGTTSTSYAIQNLQGFTDYEIKMKAVDIFGNEIETEKIQTKTRPLYADGTFNSSKGVNTPLLAEGMEAVYWNGTTEVTSANPYEDTNFDYNSWYDYKEVETVTYDYTDYVQTGLSSLYDGRYNTSSGYSSTAQAWADLSGNGNHGEIHGATWTEDNGLYFDGEDDFVNLGQVQTEELTNLTWEVSFVSNRLIGESDGRYGNIINNQETGGIAINIYNNIGADLWNGSSYTSVRKTLNAQVSQRYTASVTYDGKKIKLYVNGQIVKITTLNGKISIPLNSVPIILGGNSAAEGQSVGDFFKGTIYGARIYDRTLTAEEIAHNYEVDLGTASDKTSKWANAKTADGSYWVWIPRYAYSITSGYHGEGLTYVDGVTQEAGTIDVEFLQGKTNTSAKGRTQYNEAAGANNWNIHPAFYYDGTSTTGTQLAGIWVAKYEMSMETNGVVTETSSSSVGNVSVVDNTSVKAVSKPGVKAWTYISESNMFVNSLNYDTTSLSNAKLDSHLMKNSEWGAVTYLTHSKYGRNSVEIIANTFDGYYTAGGNGATPHSNVLQSSTGNCYGVFDLSGGCWEIMAAYIGENNKENYQENIFASENRYIDIYDYPDSESDYGERNDVRIYGDGLWEVSYSANLTTSGARTAWFEDFVEFPNYNFIQRGAAISDVGIQGIFTTWVFHTEMQKYHSFRVVLWGETTN